MSPATSTSSATNGVLEKGVSPKTAAKILGVSLSTVWRRLRDGSLPYLQLGGAGKRIVIDSSLLKAVRDATDASPPITAPNEQLELIDNAANPSRSDEKKRLSGPQPEWTGTDYLRNRSQVKRGSETYQEASAL